MLKFHILAFTHRSIYITIHKSEYVGSSCASYYSGYSSSVDYIRSDNNNIISKPLH